MALLWVAQKVCREQVMSTLGSRWVAALWPHAAPENRSGEEGRAEDEGYLRMADII